MLVDIKCLWLKTVESMVWNSQSHSRPPENEVPRNSAECVEVIRSKIKQRVFGGLGTLGKERLGGKWDHVTEIFLLYFCLFRTSRFTERVNC